MFPTQAWGAVTSLGNEAADVVGSGIHDTSNALGAAFERAAFPPPAPSTLSIVRTTQQGDSFERKTLPFQQSGTIIYADRDRIVQQTRSGETFMYSTRDILKTGPAGDQALAALEAAARDHQSVNLNVSQSGINLSALQQSLQRDQVQSHTRSH